MSKIKVTEEQFDRLSETLEAPFAPNGELKEAMAKFKEDQVEPEPTQEQIEKEAAKQLMTELFMIQRRIFHIAMNSMLLVQMKQLSRGLISKYHNLGLLKGENIEVKYIRRLNQVEFVPTPHLKDLFNQISNELAQQAIDHQDAEDSLNA